MDYKSKPRARRHLVAESHRCIIKDEPYMALILLRARECIQDALAPHRSSIVLRTHSYSIEKGPIHIE
jgi:hypothetical protein